MLPPEAVAFEAERQREAAARFQRTRTPPYMRRLASPSRPGERGPTDNPPIRMNAAAILRELKFYKRREQQLVQQCAIRPLLMICALHLSALTVHFSAIADLLSLSADSRRSRPAHTTRLSSSAGSAKCARATNQRSWRPRRSARSRTNCRASALCSSSSTCRSSANRRQTAFGLRCAPSQTCTSD